jgi:hypothetical protein
VPFQSPEKLLERHEGYVAKRARLNHFDKLCHAASVKFRYSHTVCYCNQRYQI